MSNKHIHRSEIIAVPGSAQAGAAPFAQASHDAEQATVRQLFRTPAPDGAPKEEAPALGAPFADDEQDAAPEAVLELLGGASPEPELSGTGFTYRHDWGARRGQWRLRLNWAAVNPRSRVLVAIGEGAAGGLDNGKFIGGARYSLHNVAPRPGGVDIWVNVEWSSSIPLYVDYLVVNP